MRGLVGVLLVSGLFLGCGGSAPPEAKEPHPLEEERTFMEQAEGEPERRGPTRADLREQEEERRRKEREEKDKEKQARKPEFTENMSVDEAIKAVPPETERYNLDQETIAEPLRDMKVYEPCKPKPNESVNIRVAIWEGKAVGVDVETKPQNPTLAECIKGRIRELRWRESVPSLETIEFGF